MKIFISEAVCGGAWPETNPESLAHEGGAMLTAMAADAAALPGCEVSVTWDERLPPPQFHAGVHCRTVGSAKAKRDAFVELAQQADGVMVIAPESGGMLFDRLRWLADFVDAEKIANVSAPVVDLTADKLRTAEHLGRCGVPTVPTWRPDAVPREVPFPRVVKPRFGCGSDGIDTIGSAAQWEQRRNDFDTATGWDQFVVQPLVPGRAASIGVVVDTAGQRHLLPIVRQRLSSDRKFRYLGGELIPGPVPASVGECVMGVLDTLEGVRGYIGFDVLLDPEGELIAVVEINPRLTTSYVGYRAASLKPLTAWMFGSPSQPPQWNPEKVIFSADGTIHP